MDEFNNITTEVELPEDLSVDAFEPSGAGMSDTAKTAGAIGLGIGLGLLGHWAYNKIKAKRAAKALDDDPDAPKKEKKSKKYLKLHRKEADDGVDDDDAATEETEDK